MNRVSINQSWAFTQAGTASEVNIPHTWNGLDGQNGGNNYYRGNCIYEKTLFIESDPQKILYLEVEAANSIANVYINDVHAGEHRGGYSTFRFNITAYIQFGEHNDIRIEVDNSHDDSVYPLMADFTFMGGIYRDVHLVYCEPIHIDLEDEGSCGIYVAQTNVSDQKACLTISTRLRNATSEAANIFVTTQLIDHNKSIVAETEQHVLVNATAVLIQELTQALTQEHAQALTLDNPRLWQGVDDPYLYQLIVEVRQNGNLIDSRTIPTGLRYFEVCPDQGFILNGKKLPLKGVSRHQDRQDVGWALNREHQEKDMAIIQDVGANSIRLAHYQHNQYFYDLCDQAGMVVWAEIPYITRTSPAETDGKNALKQMSELVKQNYNHPGIIFWGIQNEITIAGKANNVDGIVSALHAQTKALDPYRLTTQAQVSMLAHKDPLNRASDINAYNKYYGWYNGHVEEFDTWISDFHRDCPDIPLGISEYGAEGIQMYHNDAPRRSDYSEEYHALYHEKVLEIFSRHDYLWGTYVWNMFDFACDLRDEGGVKGMNNKGLVRHDHTTKKDAFYIYQARWSEKPMVFITSKGYKKRPTEMMSVKVYSNQNEVSLKINGKVFDSKIGAPVFIFEDVPLNEGLTEIEVTCPGTDLRDQAIFEKVSEPEPSYLAPPRKNPLKDAVQNWFNSEDEKGNAEPMLYPAGYFSIKSRVGDVCDNAEGEQFMRQHLAPLFDHPMFDFIKNMSFKDLADMNKGSLTPPVLKVLNRGLTKIKTP